MYYFYILIFIWFLSAILDYNNFCYYWQLKEYRWDRFKDFLISKKGQQFSILILITILVSLLLMVYFSFFLLEAFYYSYYFLLIFILLVFVLRFFEDEWLHPKFTKKSLVIVLISLLLEILLIFVFKVFLILFIIIPLRIFIISLLILFLKIPNSFLKKYYSQKAAAKLKQYPKLKVIGITGSYGKTTTKEFLAQILDSKFKVIKTPEHVNTEIGIAKFILAQDFSEIEVFIVEMGAYKIGEIASICDLVQPKMGILTAINQQHLALFGSQENIQQAKYELLQSLPVDGLAVVNNDNKLCREKLSLVKAKVITYGQKDKFKPQALISAIKTQLDSLEFDLNLENQKFSFFTKVKGEYNLMNIAPAVLIAIHLGLSEEEIVSGVRKVELKNNYLETYKYGKVEVINDSYSSNPTGFQAVLKLFEHYPKEKRRIIITRGMIELGKDSYQLHREIGKKIGEQADELIIISPDNASGLIKGVEDFGKKIKVVKIFRPLELVEYLKKLKEVDSVIILENRMPSIVLKEIKQ